MNRSVLPVILLLAGAISAVQAAPITNNLTRTTKHTIRQDAPGSPFLPITRYQTLWNGTQHLFYVRVVDSHNQTTVFKITVPKEFEEVLNVLQSPAGAMTDGTSIASNMVSPAK